MSKQTLMPWFLGNPGDSLLEQVKQGIAYHNKAHEYRADMCLVHPVEFDQLMDVLQPEERELVIDGARVRPWRGVVLRHAFIGLDVEEEYESIIRLEMERSRREEEAMEPYKKIIGAQS